MSTTFIAPVRRRILGVALLAALGAGGTVATVAATHDSSPGSAPAAMKVLRDTDGMCWYKGWFKEGGVWYQGYFKEAC